MFSTKAPAQTLGQFLLDWLVGFLRVAGVVLVLAYPSIDAAWADAHSEPAPAMKPYPITVLDCHGHCH